MFIFSVPPGDYSPFHDLLFHGKEPLIGGEFFHLVAVVFTIGRISGHCLSFCHYGKFIKAIHPISCCQGVKYMAEGSQFDCPFCKGQRPHRVKEFFFFGGQQEPG